MSFPGRSPLFSEREGRTKEWGVTRVASFNPMSPLFLPLQACPLPPSLPYACYFSCSGPQSPSTKHICFLLQSPALTMWCLRFTLPSSFQNPGLGNYALFPGLGQPAENVSVHNCSGFPDCFAMSEAMFWWQGLLYNWKVRMWVLLI